MKLVWNTGRRELLFDRRPLVMAILNVTPDSFSDGGKHNDLDHAVQAGLRMQEEGADIIDIGGESTRPYSDPVAIVEELDRVIPVIQQLAPELSVPISIDTSKAAVAEAAIRAGAEIINDVTGLQGDPAMAGLASSTGVGVCVMHMQGTPQTMQDNPKYENVVEEIYDYLLARQQFCFDGGIRLDRICLDPGIGFGKSHEHNLQLLHATGRFTEIGRPILIGHSRKGFIRKLIGEPKTDLMAGTLGVSLAVAAAGAHIVRVHDVRETTDAIRLFRAAGGFDSFHDDKTVGD